MKFDQTSLDGLVGIGVLDGPFVMKFDPTLLKREGRPLPYNKTNDLS